MTPSLIETVAMAIRSVSMFDSASKYEEIGEYEADRIARAALQAIEASGYTIMPTTLTDEMKQAGEAQAEAWCAIDNIYAALLSARPKVTE